MRLPSAPAKSARSTLGAALRPSTGRLLGAAKLLGAHGSADSVRGDASGTLGGRRRDIQALRALAVIAVFAYHVAPGSLPGGFVGVDVFFVVSGYLVGGALVAEVASTGRVALGRFYARRLRRIAPLATVVALVTIVFAAFTESPLRLILWGSPAAIASVTRDGISSVLGVANLWFGFSDVGYVMNDYVSPFLHYWSLGVEEQFYLVAPFALMLAFRAGRKVGTLAIAAMSLLAFDLATVGFAPGGFGTFYNPLSRAWELGVGVLVAISVPWLRAAAPRGVWTTVIVWSSWLGLAACAVAIATPYRWPTPSAILPVAATAAILAGGVVRRAGRIASLTVLQWLGDRSYGIYLWHWPVIVLAVPYSPLAHVPTIAAAIVATLGLSAASYRWIELPIRRLPLVSRSQVRRMLATGIAVIAGGLTVLTGVGVWASTSPVTTSMHAKPYQFLPAGAPQQAFATSVPFNLTPELRNASSDKPVAYTDGCNVKTVFKDVHLSDCVYGTKGPLVALFGDSHALQWLGALLPATKRGDIRLALVTADACPPFDPGSLDYRHVCADWHRLAVARLNELKPDLIIASASLSEPALKDDASVVAASLAVGRLPAELHGAQVLWIVDTPAFDEDPSACAAKDVVDITSCAMPRDAALSPMARAPIQGAVIANGWHWVDLNDYLCDKTECGIILGDVFMYRDDDHLSSTFASKLSPALMQAVLPLVHDENAPGGS